MQVNTNFTTRSMAAADRRAGSRRGRWVLSDDEDEVHAERAAGRPRRRIAPDSDDEVSEAESEGEGMSVADSDSETDL